MWPQRAKVPKCYRLPRTSRTTKAQLSGQAQEERLCKGGDRRENTGVLGDPNPALPVRAWPGPGDPQAQLTLYLLLAGSLLCPSTSSTQKEKQKRQQAGNPGDSLPSTLPSQEAQAPALLRVPTLMVTASQMKPAKSGDYDTRAGRGCSSESSTKSTVAGAKQDAATHHWENGRAHPLGRAHNGIFVLSLTVSSF